jgi:hypothetical protein
MAIFTGGTASAQPQVQAGMNFTVGAQGQGVVNQSNNNRMKPTPAFAALDAQILSLDAMYEQLSDKSPWVTYAANIGGLWQLCANCEPDAGPKKLYRQYNFNRSILGLPSVSAPIDDTEWAHASDFSIGYEPSTGAPSDCTFLANYFSEQDYYLLQTGQVMANQYIILGPLDTPPVWFPGDRIFDFWLPYLAGPPISCCTFTASGAPGRKIVATIIRL